jgi:hypothetical protein
VLLLYKSISMEKIIEEEINKLNSINDEVKLVWKANLDAGNGIFLFDFFVLPLLNKVFNINRAYISLIEDNNFIAAGTLVRIQLDVLLRVFASTIIGYNVDEFAKKLLSGEQLNNMNDSRGNLMRDGYLAKELNNYEDFNWVKYAYDKGNLYVHLTPHSLYSSSKLDDNERNIVLTIGPNDSFVSDDEKYAATMIMTQITSGILHFVSIWILHKVDSKKND